MEPRFLAIFMIALSFPLFVQSLVRHYNFSVSTLLILKFAGSLALKHYQNDSSYATDKNDRVDFKNGFMTCNNSDSSLTLSKGIANLNVDKSE